MNLETQVKSCIHNALNIDSSHLTLESPLLGNYPEFDSMGIMMLLMEFEQTFAIDSNLLELSAETFATLGALVLALQDVCIPVKQSA
ncbi:acyl carrier protein [Thalassotalea marina]|uniref:Carrier domain-containing protein n=1 Tax=Thalassotalea marina TaxID=1673741 RepID=A0A919B9X5_9GAMM|nr:acyl carrier protein [Thalassotalea marina]GHF77855.1 hypothetical protein GCM10017161_01060 [Thalassotalea marina]